MKTKFRKSLGLILSVVLLIGLFSGISVFALEADYDYSVLSDGTVEITYYKGAGSNVVIPDTINGRTVTSIGNNAFSMKTSMKTVEIPETVTNIGDSAFKSCSGLTEIVLPESIKTIGASAFAMCTGLKSIVIQHRVTSIGEGAFTACYSLTDVCYTGPQMLWDRIDMGEGNDFLTEAAIEFNYKFDEPATEEPTTEEPTTEEPTTEEPTTEEPTTGTDVTIPEVDTSSEDIFDIIYRIIVAIIRIVKAVMSLVGTI